MTVTPPSNARERSMRRGVTRSHDPSGEVDRTNRVRTGHSVDLRWPSLRGSQPVSYRLCRGWELTVIDIVSTVCLLSAWQLVAAVVTEHILLSGSKALTVEHYGLVPVHKNRYAIRLSGFVPR